MSIESGQDILVTDFILQVVAGENLATRDAVYIDSSDGKAYKCDADDLTKLGFKGFVIAGVSATATVSIRHDCIHGGFSGLTIGALYYLSGTPGAITATKPTNYKIVGVAITATQIKIANFLTKKTTLLTATNSGVGAQNTQFDITNPAGTTFRYTWDGTGTDPGITAITFPIGTVVDVQAENFNANNNGLFVVTGSGANYFEVANASGVAETNKTIGIGYISKGGATWTKPGGLVKMKIYAQGAGGAGESTTNTAGAGAGGGGCAIKTFYDSELGATEIYHVGYRQSDTASPGPQRTVFGLVHNVCGNPGLAPVGGRGGLGGTAINGDLNIYGGGGAASGSGATGSGSNNGMGSAPGGSSFFGGGGAGVATDDTGIGGGQYGGGGAGSSGTGSGTNTGGPGSDGCLLIEEWY